MESLFSKDCILWDRYGSILDNHPEIQLKQFEKRNFTETFYTRCEELLEQYNKFAVSISGGVDSMLLSYYCSAYAKRNKKEFMLIHINYNNRKCCPEEVKFLNDWSHLIDAPLKIKEMQIIRDRSSKYREDYERTTKKIRFDFYKSFGCPVLLGHNKDDCYENIFANLSKQIHFDNLFGMRPISVNNDVTIIRPFINSSKRSIIEKALYLNIPYLEDSTPAWSVRGKMRDSLIPMIQDFDCNILKGFDEYIKTTRFFENYWEKKFNIWRDSVNENIISETVKSYTIDKIDEFYVENFQEMSFWIKFWFTLQQQSRPSNKSFRQLIEKLKTPFTRNSTHILGKQVKINITENHLVIHLE